MWPLNKTYPHDVFLSHAFEDKDAIGNDLFVHLKATGLDVWYSGDALNGDLHNSIKNAIDQSRFGVVIFSKAFINSVWTLKELAWLEQKESDKTKVIIRVLHEMTIEELAEFSPHHASRFCIHANRGLDYTVNKITHEINQELRKESDSRKRILKWTASVIAALGVVASAIGFTIYNHRPSNEQIIQSITERIESCSGSIENKYARQLRESGAKITQAEIDSTRQVYNAIRSYYRNEYEFENCFASINSRKRVEAHLGLDVVEMADRPGYGLDSLDSFWSNKQFADGWRHAGFSMINKRPTSFSWEGFGEGSVYIVKVEYKNNIRLINVSLSLPPAANLTKRHEMLIAGFSPRETYYFEENAEGEWYLRGVE